LIAGNVDMVECFELRSPAWIKWCDSLPECTLTDLELVVDWLEERIVATACEVQQVLRNHLFAAFAELYDARSLAQLPCRPVLERRARLWSQMGWACTATVDELQGLMDSRLQFGKAYAEAWKDGMLIDPATEDWEDAEYELHDLEYQLRGEEPTLEEKGKLVTPFTKVMRRATVGVSIAGKNQDTIERGRQIAQLLGMDVEQWEQDFRFDLMDSGFWSGEQARVELEHIENEILPEATTGEERKKLIAVFFHALDTATLETPQEAYRKAVRDQANRIAKKLGVEDRIPVYEEQ
jgi:hypothetical protein